MPIRWRLTLWYTGVLLLLLFILGISVYYVLEYSLMNEIDRELDLKSDEIIKSTKVVGALPFFLRQVVLPDVEVFAAPDIYLQVVAKNGEVVARSKNLENYTLPIKQDSVEKVLRGESVFYTFMIENQRIRMGIKPLLLDNSIVGFLQVARPLKSVAQALQRLQGIFIVGGIISLLLSLGLGWFLSAKALSPINGITNEARMIGEKQDFRRRVSYYGPKDEVGELAITFNKMLGNLEEAYKHLSDTLEAQKRFVSDASHELRTPLTSIQGNLDFLLHIQNSGVNRDEIINKEALEDINSEVKRLTRLVNSLLTLARVDAGFHFDLKEEELKPLLEDTLRQVRFLVRGQDFRADIKDAEDVVLKINGDYFRQMLYIFFDNAFKYTPRGKKVFFFVAKAKDSIELIFKDEGSGMKEEHLEHIYERFYRVQEAREGSGSGLGLAIASWIIEEHGGEVEVESTIGCGTTFKISFPILRLF